MAHLAGRALPLHRYFVIGGAGLYSEVLDLSAVEGPAVDRLLLTRVLEPAFEDCDTFVDELAQMTDGAAREGGAWAHAAHSELCDWVGFEVPEGPQEEKGVRYEFQMWVRRQ
jgi:dihydrofolate reductase